MIEILIDKKENEKEIALVENGNLIEYYIDENNEMHIYGTGNITFFTDEY